MNVLQQNWFIGIGFVWEVYLWYMNFAKMFDIFYWFAVLLDLQYLNFDCGTNMKVFKFNELLRVMYYEFGVAFFSYNPRLNWVTK